MVVNRTVPFRDELAIRKRRSFFPTWPGGWLHYESNTPALRQLYAIECTAQTRNVNGGRDAMLKTWANGKGVARRVAIRVHQ